MLFGAGSCTGFYWQPTLQKIDIFGQYREAINQGKIAAYNILGLAIPYYMTPFVSSKHFGRTLQRVGTFEGYDKVHIEGNPGDLDFTAIYSKKGYAFGALISSSQKNRANVFAEGMRYGFIEKVDDFTERLITWEGIEQKLKEDPKYRCFNNEIYNVRFEPIPKLILWKTRDKMGDVYYNPKEDLQAPSLEALDAK